MGNNIMTTKHTLGPWQPNPIGNTDRASISAPHKDGGGQNVVDECKWCDAPLIASAPEMLQALRDALEVLETAHRYFPKSIKNSDTFRLLNVEANSVRAAIAKATGGSL